MESLCRVSFLLLHEVGRSGCHAGAVRWGWRCAFTLEHFMAKRSDGRQALGERELSIDAVPFATYTSGAVSPILTVPQRRRLAALATRLRLPPRTTVYREGDALSWIFINADGVVKSFRELSSGKRRVVAFLFPKDVFGLAENGRYVNTTKTVTAATLYRIPHEALVAVLQRDAELQFKFMCKVTQRLREAQRQTILIGRRDAVGRLVMFFKMLEPDGSLKPQETRIQVPMSRTDIAEYLGLTPEAVSRATRQLERQRIVAFEGSHTARVMNREGFESIVAAV
jgi:CRP/FNR family transcriptional regulator